MDTLLYKTSLPSFVKDYLFSLVKKKRKTSTIKRYIYDLEDFFHWLQAEKKDHSFSTWATLTPNDIGKYLDILIKTRKYQPRTTKRVITVLSQLYKYYDNQGLSQNPILKIDPVEFSEALMNDTDFITDSEIHQLFSSIQSDLGLSENQLKTRHFIVKRNEAIFVLFLYYGLTLNELTEITMKDVQFEANTIDIENSLNTREITLRSSHKQLLFGYYQIIPKPVRPRYHEEDPFFVAFDFQRKTFRWNYETNQPKKLTNIAIQRMLQKEIKRGGIRKGISAQHLRNTFIYKQISSGADITSLQQQLGLKTDVSLKKYYRYYDSRQ